MSMWLTLAQSPGFQVRHTTPVGSTQFWLLVMVGALLFLGGLVYVRAESRRGAARRQEADAALLAEVKGLGVAVLEATAEREDDEAADAKAEAEAAGAELGDLGDALAGGDRAARQRLTVLRQRLQEALDQL